LNHTIYEKTQRSKHKTRKEGRSNRETGANPKINVCTIHIGKLIDLNEKQAKKKEEKDGKEYRDIMQLVPLGWSVVFAADR
jgi:F0F1-type ATP synthase alpha subunit